VSGPTPTPWIANDAHSGGNQTWRLESLHEHGVVNDGWVIAEFFGPDAEANAKLCATVRIAKPQPVERTERGFAIDHFTDRNGVRCSIQKSSLADEDCIWLGCVDPDPKTFVPGKSWQSHKLPPQTICNTRMHLTVEQVEALLPLLQHFVATGELP
jgi:hypothetical protein